MNFLLTIASQVVYSLSNMLMQFSLSRYGGAEELSNFALYSSVLIIISSWHGAIFLTSYSVNLRGNGDGVNSMPKMYSAIFFPQVVITSIFSIFVVGFFLVGFSRMGKNGILSIFLIIYPVALLTRDYVRITRFSIGHYFYNLKFDLLYFLFVFVALSYFAYVDQLTTINAVSICSVLMVITLTFSVCKSLSKPDIDSTKSSLRLLWINGRWELLSSCFSWVYSQGWIWASAYYFGDESLAVLVASRLLLNPLGMVWVAVSNYYRSKAINGFEANDPNNFRSTLTRGVLTISFLWIGYVFVLWFLLPIYANQVLKGKSLDFVNLIAWSIYFLLAGMNTLIGVYSRLSGSFKSLCFGYGVAAFVAVSLFFIIYSFGASYVMIVYAICIAECVLLYKNIRQTNKGVNRAA